MVALVLCSGYHPAAFTGEFVRGLGLAPQRLMIFPTEEQSPHSGSALYDCLCDRLALPAQAPPLLFIAFSAGVVAAVAGSQLWQQRGGRVAALIAVDGWGVPDLGATPLYRLSHDHFTHWSSALLGAGAAGFWAEPAVEHLQLWRSPQTISGWCEWRPGWRSRSTAADFLRQLLDQYRGNEEWSILS
ncbi:MAG: hypothetical protein HC910_02895 [Spirulinaceae cyanobacterium SM2_1_0]|nr:hypothetical protein [Spirulinaceae cyanobacterium SM2_1_0]